jgi:hypothetical protein
LGRRAFERAGRQQRRRTSIGRNWGALLVTRPIITTKFPHPHTPATSLKKQTKAPHNSHAAVLFIIRTLINFQRPHTLTLAQGARNKKVLNWATRGVPSVALCVPRPPNKRKVIGC